MAHTTLLEISCCAQIFMSSIFVKFDMVIFLAAQYYKLSEKLETLFCYLMSSTDNL